MSGRDLDETLLRDVAWQPADDARPVLPPTAAAPAGGVAVGTLVALAEDGCTALVVHPHAPETAAHARSTVDLRGPHIGGQVVLMFENGDVQRPIVMGVLKEPAAAVPEAPAGALQLEADGARLLVAARTELVLRCGKASITLTRAGKVIIQGTYVSSVSEGVNRVKGGSVQLN